VENVPASFRNEGQEVLAVEKADNGRWRVDIRKKQ
jgi:TusA-related sulfurtransferase